MINILPFTPPPSPTRPPIKPKTWHITLRVFILLKLYNIKLLCYFPFIRALPPNRIQKSIETGEKVPPLAHPCIHLCSIPFPVCWYHQYVYKFSKSLKRSPLSVNSMVPFLPVCWHQYIKQFSSPSAPAQSLSSKWPCCFPCIVSMRTKRRLTKIWRYNI